MDSDTEFRGARSSPDKCGTKSSAATYGQLKKSQKKVKKWITRGKSDIIFGNAVSNIGGVSPGTFPSLSFFLLATMMIILPRNIDDETCAKTQIHIS